MVQSSSRHGGTPRTVFKIVLMLGLALAGVAALADEPPKPDAASTTTCAETQFTFGGRTIENGEVTDTWTLTCWRKTEQEAAMPPAAPKVPAAKPVDALPVATQPVHQPPSRPSMF